MYSILGQDELKAKLANLEFILFDGITTNDGRARGCIRVDRDWVSLVVFDKGSFTFNMDSMVVESNTITQCGSSDSVRIGSARVKGSRWIRADTLFFLSVVIGLVTIISANVIAILKMIA